MRKPKVANAGGIRFIEYRFPTARDCRRFIQTANLENRFDLSARIYVDPPAERRDNYKRQRGMSYFAVWSQEGDERKPNAHKLRLMSRLLRKEAEVVNKITPLEYVILRVAERSDPVYRITADGTTKRRSRIPDDYARLESIE